MLKTEKQKEILDAIKAMAHGMAPAEKRATQEKLLAGAVVALDALGLCPADWKSLLMVGRAHKLFGRTYGSIPRQP
jgi:hypothetical protein